MVRLTMKSAGLRETANGRSSTATGRLPDINTTLTILYAAFGKIAGLYCRDLLMMDK